MPKDRAEVQDQYKIGGGSLNEYEFEQSKGEYEEQAHQPPDDAPVEGLHGAAEPNAPQNVAERIRQVEERAHEIVERRRAKRGGGAVKSAKAATKPAAGKKAAKKAGGAKGGAKAASRKGGAKGSAKKGGAAKKSGAGKGAKAGAKKGSAKGGAKKGSAKKGGAKKGASKSGAKGSAKKGGSRR